MSRTELEVIRMSTLGGTTGRETYDTTYQPDQTLTNYEQAGAENRAAPSAMGSESRFPADAPFYVRSLCFITLNLRNSRSLKCSACHPGINSVRPNRYRSA